jgi:hypothetical protein
VVVTQGNADDYQQVPTMLKSTPVVTDRVKSTFRKPGWLWVIICIATWWWLASQIKFDDGMFKVSLVIGRDESIDIWDEAQVLMNYLARDLARTGSR